MDNTFITQRLQTFPVKVDGTNYTAAAGTTDLRSEPVDTQGFETVRFIAIFGAITSGAVTSTSCRQGAASDMSDGADLAGSAQSVPDTASNKVVITEIRQPQERYVDHLIDRGTQNAVVLALLVELSGARKLPVSAHSRVSSQEFHSSPDEGTA